MIEIHLLEQLVTFAQCGTLSAAAEKLHTSQPALTRSMKKLETLLDVTLFYRSKNRLVLNECGKLAVTWANRVLEENREFERRVKAYDRSFHTITRPLFSDILKAKSLPLVFLLFIQDFISQNARVIISR